MIAVIDASVIVKWFFPDPVRESGGEQALSVLQAVRTQTLEVLQPPHWLAEVAAVLSRIQPEIAGEAIDLLDAMELPIVTGAAVHKRAAALSASLGQHVFDTLYHAVALGHEGYLISADRRYCRKAARLGRIIDLADWHPERDARGR